MGVRVAVRDGVSVLVGVLIDVDVEVGEFVGDGVVVGVAVGLGNQTELAAFGLPRMETPLASCPLMVLPSFVPQAEGLSGMIPNLSIDARVTASPTGQLPPEIFAVSTVSPAGPSKCRVSPLLPKTPV